MRQRLLLVPWMAGVVSIGCNVLSAAPTVVGRLVAAWPPVALLLVVEVLARSPVPPGHLRWVAMVGAAAVAAVAAVASFHHMHSVALAVGESELVAWLFPFSVDGLAVVTAVALVGSTQPTTPTPAPHDRVAVVGIEEAVTAPGGAGSVSLFVPPLVGASFLGAERRRIKPTQANSTMNEEK